MAADVVEDLSVVYEEHGIRHGVLAPVGQAPRSHHDVGGAGQRGEDQRDPGQGGEDGGNVGHRPLVEIRRGRPMEETVGCGHEQRQGAACNRKQPVRVVGAHPEPIVLVLEKLVRAEHRQGADAHEREDAEQDDAPDVLPREAAAVLGRGPERAGPVEELQATRGALPRWVGAVAVGLRRRRLQQALRGERVLDRHRHAAGAGREVPGVRRRRHGRHRCRRLRREEGLAAHRTEARLRPGLRLREDLRDAAHR
mmetsp:Transcript_23386/g.51926  ORF Transcript_23386/g.51926 Transcript_23386/m.51926 type:complete len:253 (+) Transcript_23386:904-1662(+)